MNKHEDLITLLENEPRFHGVAECTKLKILKMEKELKERQIINHVKNDSLYNTDTSCTGIDPYIESHQKRVSLIACNIARRMGLAEKRIADIRISGILHDIGMIYIPAEIVNAREKLNYSDFAIVHTHPEVAYKILKNIDFTRPIADIVRQHHEKINGSGYPRGLKGSDILLEAKILSVADVYDAMVTDRPYRKGHSISAAIQEIVKNQRILYNGDVVDAFLTVVLEGNLESGKKRLCTDPEVEL